MRRGPDITKRGRPTDLRYPAAKGGRRYQLEAFVKQPLLDRSVMNTTARLASVGGLALAATTLLASPANASPGQHHRSPHPVFVQTDNPNGNTIVAYDRHDDGTLQQAGVYATDGLGGVLTGSVVDHLASQGSLAYDATHRLLYALNAGSNTVTVFAVHGDHLGRRQVISSGGTFPVSITTHGNVVYVLN